MQNRILVVSLALGMVTLNTVVGATTQATSRAVHLPTSRKNVAILVFDGATIIDYAGPYAVFGQAYFNGKGALNIYTVAETAEPLMTDGLRITPKFSFADAPKPDILVIPGGNVSKTIDNQRVIAWVQANAKVAEYVLSVCSGSFILAKAGLLDGLIATTLAPLIEDLRTSAPQTKVVSNKRYVDNGKVIATAGLSSGIDGALYVLSKLMGAGVAQQVANSLEYNWDPKAKYVRAQLADFHFLHATFDLLMAFPALPKSSEGDREHWESMWQVWTDSSATEVFDRINQTLAVDDKWTRRRSSKSEDKLTSAWTFTDEQGQGWLGVVSVKSVSGEQNKLLLSINDARVKARNRRMGKGFSKATR
jgi:putative intracellular protease/amidase